MDDRFFFPVVSHEGIYGVRLVSSAAVPITEVDTLPSSYQHPRQGSFTLQAACACAIARASQDPGVVCPCIGEPLIDATVGEKVRVTVHFADTERLVVVFSERSHPVSKSLTRMVRRAIQKMLASEGASRAVKTVLVRKPARPLDDKPKVAASSEE